MILQLHVAFIIIGASGVSVTASVWNIDAYVCTVEREDRLDDPPSPGDCAEPASRGEAAITTS